MTFLFTEQPQKGIDADCERANGFFSHHSDCNRYKGVCNKGLKLKVSALMSLPWTMSWQASQKIVTIEFGIEMKQTLLLTDTFANT